MAGIFRPELLRVTLLGGILGLGAHGGYHAVMTQFADVPENRAQPVGIELGRLSGGDHCRLLVWVRGQWLPDRPYWSAHEHFAVRYLLRDHGAVLCVYATDQHADAVPRLPAGLLCSRYSGQPRFVFNELYPADVRGAGVGFATTSAACCRQSSRSWWAT